MGRVIDIGFLWSTHLLWKQDIYSIVLKLMWGRMSIVCKAFVYSCLRISVCIVHAPWTLLRSVAPTYPSTHGFFNVKLLHLPENISPNKFQLRYLFKSQNVPISMLQREREGWVTNGECDLFHLFHHQTIQTPHIVHDQPQWALFGLNIQGRPSQVPQPMLSCMQPMSREFCADTDQSHAQPSSICYILFHCASGPQLEEEEEEEGTATSSSLASSIACSNQDQYQSVSVRAS